MATLPAKGAMPEDSSACLGLGGYPRAVYSTGQSRKFAEEADLVIALVAPFASMPRRAGCPNRRTPSSSK